MIWSKTNNVSKTNSTVFSGQIDWQMSLMEASTSIILTWSLKFFNICVFEAAFPNGYLLDFGQVMLFLNPDKWNSFWTAFSGANCLYCSIWRKTYNIQTWKYEKASLIFVGNVYKKSLVSVLHCLKQLLWKRIFRGIFAPGIRKSDSLFTDILIDVWWLFFRQLAQLAFKLLIENYTNRKGVSFC